MSRGIQPPDGWVAIAHAASRMGMHPHTLRRQVADGDFTRLRRSTGKTTDIFIPEVEVSAFIRGGIDAVIALRTALTPPKSWG